MNSGDTWTFYETPENVERPEFVQAVKELLEMGYIAYHHNTS